MASYKVIQDIEAEDKLVGPFSLRQFIYAIIVFTMGFIAYKLALVAPYLAIPFLPPMALFGLLAAPFGADQSSEVWLLAKIRFFLKPRRRIWNQTGIQQLVTITAPKHIERQLTNGLSQTEVKSRLQALANTIDSRGWAVKNVNVNLYAQPGYVTGAAVSDRLVDASTLPQEVPLLNITAMDDMMDERNNPTAQHLNQMIIASEQQHRQQALQQMQQAATNTQAPSQSQQPADYWFLNATAGQSPAANMPGYTAFTHNPTIAPGQAAPAGPVSAVPTAAEQDFLEKQHHESQRANPMHSHLRTILPLSEQRAQARQRTQQEAPQQTQQPPVPHTPNPAILGLANNDDLSVATIARQAKKSTEQSDDGEVVISLH